MTLHTDMAAYYAARAATYDDIYARPERQDDLQRLHRRVRELAAGERVLELACGTGYWTIDLAAVAEQVLATDINADVLAHAAARDLPAGKVRLLQADAYADAAALAADAPCTACFAGFWWSHVPRERQAGFLAHLRGLLAPQARLVLIDNVYVEGSSTPIARTDAEGNTYQIRRLADGSRHEVLKNFPTDSALRKKFSADLKDIRVERLEFYWMLTARFK
jgi:SAM-dependent methyltransferase